LNVSCPSRLDLKVDLKDKIRKPQSTTGAIVSLKKTIMKMNFLNTIKGYKKHTINFIMHASYNSRTKSNNLIQRLWSFACDSKRPTRGAIISMNLNAPQEAQSCLYILVSPHLKSTKVKTNLFLNLFYPEGCNTQGIKQWITNVENQQCIPNVENQLFAKESNNVSPT